MRVQPMAMNRFVRLQSGAEQSIARHAPSTGDLCEIAHPSAGGNDIE